MTTSDDDARASALARLDTLRPKREAAEKVIAQTTEAVLDALRAKAPAAEVARRSGLSESYVRTLRRNAKLPPDPRYAHLTPPKPTAKPDEN